MGSTQHAQYIYIYKYDALPSEFSDFCIPSMRKSESSFFFVGASGPPRRIGSNIVWHSCETLLYMTLLWVHAWVQSSCDQCLVPASPLYSGNKFCQPTSHLTGTASNYKVLLQVKTGSTGQKLPSFTQGIGSTKKKWFLKNEPKKGTPKGCPGTQEYHGEARGKQKKINCTLPKTSVPEQTG